MKLMKRKSPIATPEEIGRLKALDATWQKWSQRMERYAAERVGLDRATAIENFTRDPSPEHERTLMACTDTRALALQYMTVRDACKTALLKLTYELRDIVVPILDRQKAQLDKEYAKALEEETVLRAEAKKAGTVYQRKVNGPVSSLHGRISNTIDNISHLNEQRIDRTPASWLQSLS
jgi:hypothetical protein